MRPVNRGPCPTDASGAPVAFEDYQDARESLIARIGPFCSYCEVKHPALDTEHVIAKSRRGSMRLSWGNFLLACKNCNSVKGNKHVRSKDVFWPHRDNTARAFLYLTHGKVEIAKNLTKLQRLRALETMKLTGFHRDESTSPKATVRDRRWRVRSETWVVAKRFKALLTVTDSHATREMVARAAAGHGNWSVWMSVFCDDMDMQERLIDGFAGTEKVCWNGGTMKRRPGGQL